MSFRRQCRIICSPYSECAVCHHRLRWFELLPVISFLVLRSRCRYCRHPLPPRLLLFEAGGGIAGIIAGLALPDILPWFAAVIFSALLSILADIDRRYLLLPDSLVFTVLCSGLLFAACFPALSLDARIAGICAGYSSLLIINYLYRYWRNTEGIGGGDMKLLAALGAWCGWQALAGIIVVATLLALSTLCCQGDSGSVCRKIPRCLWVFIWQLRDGDGLLSAQPLTIRLCFNLYPEIILYPCPADHMRACCTDSLQPVYCHVVYIFRLNNRNEKGRRSALSD